MGLRSRLLEKAAANQLDSADPAALRDYYQSVLDSVGSVIYTVNRELRFTGVNRAWDEFAVENGCPHLCGHQILGTYLLDQMQGAPLERWRSVCQQLLDGELPRYLDEVASQEPYSWKNFSLRATPLRDRHGEIQGITFVASNITQLKKAENEMFQRLVEIRGLRQVAQTAGSWIERRHVFRQITSDIANLFSAEKCVIFLWDEQTGHLKAREPAFGLAGRKLMDLQLDMGHPADPDSLWQDLEEKDFILLNEGDEAPADMVETSARVDRLAAMLGVLRVSARIHGAILVAGRDRAFTRQEGQLLAIFAVPTALSIENAELNERMLDRAQQLTATQEQLAQLIELKETIRMPLTVLRGYLELLHDGMMGPLPVGYQPTMRILLDKSQAITNLINAASFQRLPYDAERYAPINLVDLLHQMLKRRSASFHQAGIHLVTQLPVATDEGSATVGDPEMLQRTFNTLVDHVVSICPKGGTLHVSLGKRDDVLCVEFTLEGVDIPGQHLIDVWKSDLSEVKHIVEGHGGQVWAESAAEQCSTFYVALRKRDH